MAHLHLNHILLAGTLVALSPACSSSDPPITADTRPDVAPAPDSAAPPDGPAREASAPDTAPSPDASQDMAPAPDVASGDAPSDSFGIPDSGADMASGAVSEVVTCRFVGSTSTQTCSSALGNSCSGVASCKVTLKGSSGQKVPWKSTCGGYATTLLDGTDESAVFNCKPAPDLGTSDKGLGIVSEVVTCHFKGSTSKQTCSSGSSTCSGITSCVVKVSGKAGTKLSWKSSCGGHATTLLDGKNETAAFSCAAWADAGPTDAPSSWVSEVVTCRFAGSSSSQSCYSSLGPSCSGVGSCVAKLSGSTGTAVTWKSTCGGYAYTTLDGVSESATFNCP